MGRGGRDGKQTLALSYVKPNQQGVKNEAMMALFSGNDCIRDGLQDIFIGTEKDSASPPVPCKCLCCSVCHKDCPNLCKPFEFPDKRISADNIREFFRMVGVPLVEQENDADEADVTGNDMNT